MMDIQKNVVVADTLLRAENSISNSNNANNKLVNRPKTAKAVKARINISQINNHRVVGPWSIAYSLGYFLNILVSGRNI